MSFKADFMWGAASAAAQIEGPTMKMVVKIVFGMFYTKVIPNTMTHLM